MRKESTNARPLSYLGGLSRVKETRNISNLQRPSDTYPLGTHSAVKGPAEAKTSKVVTHICAPSALRIQVAEDVPSSCLMCELVCFAVAFTVDVLHEIPAPRRWSSTKLCQILEYLNDAINPGSICLSSSSRSSIYLPEPIDPVANKQRVPRQF